MSVNIVLPSGKSLHVAFLPVTGGSSVFYTDNEDVQNGLERHCRFGRLFHLAGIVEEKAQAEKADSGSGVKGRTEKKPTEVAVSCADDAKDLLSDKYGVSRTKMKSVKAIQDAAAAYGIVFTGL